MEQGQQLYVFCTSDFFLESKTDMICSLESVGKILSDEKFIINHGFMFNDKIQSFKVIPHPNKDVFKGDFQVIISYIDRYGDLDETSYYLTPVTLYL